MNENRSIELIQNSLGIDIFPMYQSSLFQSAFPTFEHIFLEYNFAVIQQEVEVSTKQLEELNQRLKEGDWSVEDVLLPLKGNLEVKLEPDVFNHLLEQHLSFEFKGDIYNHYTKEVW